MFKHILYIHIFFGVMALLTFWIPLFAKKGSRIHIFGGRSYVTSMCMVAFTASILCSLRLINPNSTANEIQFAWFLLFISFLASSCAWYAIRVWHFKERTLPHYNILDISIAFILVISSIAMAGYGYINQDLLLTVFPLIGVFLGLGQLYYWLSTPTLKMHAWYQHMTGMFSCVISTLTAFAVVGFPRLFHIERMDWILWFGPTMIMVPILLIWKQFYRKKFAIIENKKDNINHP